MIAGLVACVTNRLDLSCRIKCCQKVTAKLELSLNQLDSCTFKSDLRKCFVLGNCNIDFFIFRIMSPIFLKFKQFLNFAKIFWKLQKLNCKNAWNLLPYTNITVTYLHLGKRFFRLVFYSSVKPEPILRHYNKGGHLVIHLK